MKNETGFTLNTQQLQNAKIREHYNKYSRKADKIYLEIKKTLNQFGFNCHEKAISIYAKPTHSIALYECSKDLTIHTEKKVRHGFLWKKTKTIYTLITVGSIVFSLNENYQLNHFHMNVTLDGETTLISYNKIEHLKKLQNELKTMNPKLL